jgi:hypothetical protein
VDEVVIGEPLLREMGPSLMEYGKNQRATPGERIVDVEGYEGAVVDL